MDNMNSFEKKEAIYNYIKNQVKVNGFPPSVREICTSLGIKSTSTVHAYIEKLKKDGLLEKTPSTSRALKLIDDEQNIIDNIVNVPILGKVAAGLPILAEENMEGSFSLPIEFAGQGAQSFILKVRGESMIEAGILNGDYLVVRHQNTAINSDIVVALIDDEVTVKTFYREKDCIRLQPQNKHLNPIIINNGSISILGKVIGVIRKI
jgi:repressor LexA